MTPGELQDLLIAALVRAHGGSQRRWRLALGPMRVLDRKTHDHCNWAVSPNGSAEQVARIEDLLDTMRLRHPFVTDDKVSAGR